MNLTRREFHKFALGTSCAAALGRMMTGPDVKAAARIDSNIHGVQFGLQPFCNHDLPMSIENRPILIQRMIQNGLGIVELHATWVEPPFSAPGVNPAEARDKIRSLDSLRAPGRTLQGADGGSWEHSRRPRGGQDLFRRTQCRLPLKRGRSFNAAAKYGGSLRIQILRPEALQSAPSWRIEDLKDTRLITARQQHQRLLENYSASVVVNLVAYLQAK